MPRGRDWTLDLFLAKTTRVESGCLEWTGCRDAAGYGDSWFRMKRERAHRIAWILQRGPIPEDIYICHRCDNPPCVDIEHLFPGEQRDNVMDMMAKGRHTTTRVTASVVAKIKELRVTGLSHAAIGREIGFGPTTVRDILAGKRWPNL